MLPRKLAGEYRCTDAEVRQMLRDASDEPQVSGVVDGFSLADLDSERRWSLRLSEDGKWAPTLFDFYCRVYPRLGDELAVPFKLDERAMRVDETPVHEALHEALVHALIHADHQWSRPITVIKRAAGHGERRTPGGPLLARMQQLRLG
ncbi:MAG: hypothetical protein AW10_01380 [Candidatus Accumulibacter appositus]|uniref:Uncharacterized protein n=2 Tax=Candidatus Accumulibacter TaxID=327159 RepID=A0A011PVI5_9PROT|nr:MAG: hypothetical protein AW10_01380 [Candidatus Accumulibacter appositus]